ncbi:23S rRNA m(5)U-1939 methyltransferase [Cognatiyoonia sediminum]|uniref:23S rRNA m(5)U-1939 methyltransferase n=1 Tax=Cognatiyoonia sediminum TaxID=1508389 RepID=A0A1M5QM48_9RHOB|nr:class I SAM-dependent RNA methyltransferase [Cognatiyoonia sediminum]SHH15142.1 23S rRNA m(5)U-1939 methyltransferase [Cognatiyoonia sediminum]
MPEVIETLTHHGLGRTPSGDLVPNVLPGETIEVADGGKVRVLEPSTDRVNPPCRHSKSCGGCSVMHASDEFVAKWKTGIVESALSARGLETEILPIYTSPAESRRRAKFSGRRTKKGAIVGFHGASSAVLVETPDCKLVVSELLEVKEGLLELVPLGASRKSEVQFTVNQSEAGPDVWVQADKPVDNALRVQLANIAQKHQFARLSWNDETIVTLKPPFVTMGPAKVVPPFGAFLQATTDAENVMVAAVKNCLGDAKRVADLFSGCGTFSFPLAETAEVHAVEGEADLIASLDTAWRQTAGLKKVSTEVRDLFRRPLEPDELNKFEAVVLDPPRAGAEAQIQCLTKAHISEIAMVSCNPITFARDAETLIDSGYQMNWVRPIDQFRWSAHVELVGRFTRV